jgi:Outer membrane protein
MSSAAQGVAARIVAVILAALLLFPMCAGAAELKVAILDVERVRRSALAVKAIHSQLGVHIDAYRSETQKEEQEIRSAQEELARKRTVLSPEAYADERRKLEEQLVGAQGRVQERRQALERINAAAMQQVQGVLETIVAEVAAEQHLTLILRKEQVVFLSPDLEVTDQVLSRLDKALPTVRVEAPVP